MILEPFPCLTTSGWGISLAGGSRYVTMFNPMVLHFKSLLDFFMGFLEFWPSQYPMAMSSLI